MKPTLPTLLSINGGYVDTAGFLALRGLFTRPCHRQLRHHLRRIDGAGNIRRDGQAAGHRWFSAIVVILALPAGR